MSLLVKHRFDIEEVAADAGLSAGIASKMMRDPAVDLAIKSWHE